MDKNKFKKTPGFAEFKSLRVQRLMNSGWRKADWRCGKNDSTIGDDVRFVVKSFILPQKYLLFKPS